MVNFKMVGNLCQIILSLQLGDWLLMQEKAKFLLQVHLKACCRLQYEVCPELDTTYHWAEPERAPHQRECIPKRCAYVCWLACDFLPKRQITFKFFIKDKHPVYAVDVGYCPSAVSEVKLRHTQWSKYVSFRHQVNVDALTWRRTVAKTRPFCRTVGEVCKLWCTRNGSCTLLFTLEGRYPSE